MKQSFILLSSLLILTACWDTPRVDTAAVREEMQSRKITYATKGELLTKAEEVGTEIIQKVIDGSLTKDSVNNIKDVELLSLNEESIKEMHPIETQIFEAYKYSYENDGILAGKNIQYDNPSGVYYVSIPEVKDSVFTMWSLRLSEKALILH